MLTHLPTFRCYDEMIAAYMACGAIAINWGPIELTIEQLLVLMRNRQNATALQFPVSYSKKRNELKDRLKAEPAFADFLERLRPLLRDASELHDLRKWVVHSICQGTNLKGEMIFGISDQKRSVAYTDRAISLEAINKASERMAALHASLSAMFKELERRYHA